MMLRLLSSGVIWTCGRLVSRRLKPKQTSSFVCVRGFSDETRDASLPNPEHTLQETQSIDLDKWKSVMKSQALLGKMDVDGTDVLEDDGPPDSPEVEAAWRLFTMWREAGRTVPTRITDEQIQALAQLPSKSAKIKYLKYLFIKEEHKLKYKQKQEQKRAEKEALLSERGVQPLENSYLLHFWFQTLEKSLLWRVAQSMQFGQPLIFDMSYESNMNSRELANCVSQLMDVEAWNKRDTDPFHLYYCNLQPDGAYAQLLLKRYTVTGWNRLMITCTDRQHVDVFPRENLVYLTADSPNVLHTFDHTKVYIIGAMVDRSVQSRVSLANAKRLNLATARLPLDKYLNWQVGGKNLTLDQMIRIMLSVKETGKWEEAFQFVPQRKHGGFNQQQPVKSVASSRVRGLGHQGVRTAVESSSRFAERNGDRTNSFVARSWSPGVTRDRVQRPTRDGGNEMPVTQTQTSPGTDSQRKRVAKRHTMWWDSE